MARGRRRYLVDLLVLAVGIIAALAFFASPGAGPPAIHGVAGADPNMMPPGPPPPPPNYQPPPQQPHCGPGETSYYSNVNGHVTSGCRPATTATTKPPGNFAPPPPAKKPTPPAGNFAPNLPDATTTTVFAPTAVVNADVPTGPQTCSRDSALNGRPIQLIQMSPCSKLDTRFISDITGKSSEPNNARRAFGILIVLLSILAFVFGVSVGELLDMFSGKNR